MTASGMAWSTTSRTDASREIRRVRSSSGRSVANRRTWSAPVDRNGSDNNMSRLPMASGLLNQMTRFPAVRW